MNALHGGESALMSIAKISLLLGCSSTDRTSHRIPSLWTWCSSTSAVGNLLTSIGQFGCIVFFLRICSDYFAIPDLEELRDLENQNSDSCEEGKCPWNGHTLINQSFAVCVRKVLDGYNAALNTVSASVSLRRVSQKNDGGCLTSISHSEISLLEVYLHTRGITTQIEALGNICNVNHLAANFPASSLEDLKTKVNAELRAFPRGADLLSFLYSQLKVADPDHRALLKFLFLKSCEPYIGFIRSWIYDGRINDPYQEFVVEYASDDPIYASEDRIASPLPIVRMRDGVPLPCFLEECLIRLFRTGQQLQVLRKLLELCNSMDTYDAYEEILPSLVDLSSIYPWFAIPLTFDKGAVETMVLARASYYQNMLEKMDDKLAKFEFSSRPATSQGFSLRVENNIGKNLNIQASSVDGISLLSGGRNRKIDTTVDSEVSSTLDEYTYGEDLFESSECSSSEISEEKNEVELLHHAVQTKEQGYLDALDFSLSFFPDHKIPNVYPRAGSCFMEDVQCKIDDASGYVSHPFYKEKNLLVTDKKSLQTLGTEVPSSSYSQWFFGSQHIHGGADGKSWLPSDGCGLDSSMRNCDLLDANSDLSENSSKVNISNKYRHPQGTFVSSQTCNLLPWKLKYDSSFFSMNPTWDRSSFFNLKTMHGRRHLANYGVAYFDFASVKDPLKEYADKLSGQTVVNSMNDLSVVPEAPETGVDIIHDIGKCSDTDVRNNAESSNVLSPLLKKESGPLPNIPDCCSWESLLGRFGNVVNRSHRDHRSRFLAAAEMPLDFVIKTCLLDEILLQYRYLSKLAIKLLVEGFKLQEHLLALRRYHFMEFADWADMFILSLWHRKWHAKEADKRIPEIQGFLELSVRRSSCEGDPNKDRLYVYLKNEGITRLSASSNGINSFDFLGLGYRVDWPVSIILTPTALKIYSEIFNFLIQLKLAVFSLSDAWLSLKSYRVELHEGEVISFSILTDTRHKINHFVSTLQRYVQSQLSQVSWCRFLNLIKHKVDDMLDLESVHMLYLTESLHICFLSSETQSTAKIIQKILQCAMDYRSCLTGRIWVGRSCDENSSNRFSEIDISQVRIIRRTFTENLEELRLLYLHSPKHVEFGICDFWDYLNYNDYYSEALDKQIGRSIF
ncbi:hypothetical protein F511_19364 [Dorcoceras hygrometricum]|uniref:Gamma-tubulin complex component n=1 Tax=Dorcoceras hygrometricum TaxID=472368 RepID=A0A2Z7CCL8_9LAMI|nr:hypothetical protein F511_19364 [Dorcoceras hygrometricum]